jgi:two-component system, response regulator YesN
VYKLVVVDDEGIIRKGMCNYIPWGEMGFKVVADFEDGKETIDYLSENPVDVILTDIEMAQVTGLKLASYVDENKLPVKVVILSGYKEFEYARKAVEYNVEYYLLKPIRLEEVQKVFGKIKTELDKVKIAEEISLVGQKKFEEMQPELKEQFWLNLLIGRISEKEQILKKSELLNLNLTLDKPCAILDVKLQENADNYFLQHENGNIWSLVHNIFIGDDISENIKYYPIHLSSKIIKIIAVTGRKENETDFYKRLKPQLEEKYRSVLKLLKLEIIITVEKVFENVSEMSQYNYMFQIHIKDKPLRDDQLLAEDYKRLMDKYKLLMEIINDGEFEELDRVMDNVFLEIENLPLKQLKQLCINIYSMILNKFMKMGNSLWIYLNEKVNYQEISDVETIDDLKVKFKNMLRDIIKVISDKQNDVSKRMVEQAILYMKKHYGEDLSLEYIADRFYLNSTYFSRLFKQYTGTTFIDYLIELRMEKAKELISLGKYKVYEISQIVGYKSEKYFFSIFKRYTGSSPAEYYRSRAINNEI